MCIKTHVQTVTQLSILFSGNLWTSIMTITRIQKMESTPIFFYHTGPKMRRIQELPNTLHAVVPTDIRDWSYFTDFKLVCSKNQRDYWSSYIQYYIIDQELHSLFTLFPSIWDTGHWEWWKDGLTGVTNDIVFYRWKHTNNTRFHHILKCNWKKEKADESFLKVLNYTELSPDNISITGCLLTDLIPFKLRLAVFL